MKKSMKIDELVFAKNSWSVKDLSDSLQSAYGITKFDLECEISNGE